jgi:hypothetical protein
MSRIRIRNAKGDDIVTIDMETGEVWHRDESDLEPSARGFWGGVSVMAEVYRKERGHEPRDTIFEGAFDVRVRPGHGGEPHEDEPGGQSGDVNIYLPSSTILEKDGGIESHVSQAK